MINFLDSRMSNLDYTLGIASNIISEASAGFMDEINFVESIGSDNLTNQIIAESGPDSSVYQSLNYMFVVYRENIKGKVEGDYYLLGFYFMKLIAGFLNFKSPNVSADLAAD